MKNIHIITGILAFVFICSTSWAQPVLQRHYSLNACSTRESVGGYDGVFWGRGEGFSDRFGKADGATKFFADAKITTPSFFSNFNYKSGYTITCWMYIDQKISKRHGKAPWLDTDPIVRIFYGTDSSNTPLISIYRRADRLVLERYTANVKEQTKNWGMWIWDPVNFTERTGWYQIIISQEKGRGHVYVFYPNGQMESCAHYFGSQDLGNAKNWGIANNGSPLIIDDLRIYEGAVNESAARQMYGQSAPPNGMYRVSLSADNRQLIHSWAHSTAISTPLEILPNDSPNDQSVYKWVFSPVSGKPGVYTIRMAYEEVYMHLVNHRADESNRVELLDIYDTKQAVYYEWYLEPTEDGYFYIRSNADRSKFLHTVGHSSSASARLEILTFSEAYASLYKWRLNLIKTTYEIEKGPGIIPNAGYDLVMSPNPFLGMSLITPIVADVAAIRVRRGAYPSLLTHWRFHRQRDDSFRIQNAALGEFNVHPKGHSITSATELEGYKFSSAFLNSYAFVLEKPNKFGRRYTIRHANNQTLGLNAGHGKSNSPIDLNYDGGTEWAFYRSDRPNRSKQLYDLKPGIYRIVSQSDDSKSITPRSFGWTSSTDLVLKKTSGERYTSQYWVVDYERDMDGTPILDGTYTIQLFATEHLYFHTKAHSLDNSVKLEVYPLSREHLDSQKWHIKATRDGTGSYFIIAAGDTERYVHLTANSAAEDSALELLDYNSTQANSYKWKFQSVSITSPNLEGVSQVITQKDQTKYLHVRGHSTAGAEPLELLTYDERYANVYKWRFFRNEDNTYLIQNVASALYIHPKARSTASSTEIEQLVYDSDYAPYYKWIIIPGTRVANTYLIVSVADPTKYIHLTGNAAAQSNPIELYPYNSSVPDTYEWKVR